MFLKCNKMRNVLTWWSAYEADFGEYPPAAPAASEASSRLLLSEATAAAAPSSPPPAEAVVVVAVSEVEVDEEVEALP